MSIRAIATATGASDQTVQRDLKSGVVNHYTSDDPEPDDEPDAGRDPADEVLAEQRQEPTVTGTDGKTYPATPKTAPAKPQRRALTATSDVLQMQHLSLPRRRWLTPGRGSLVRY